MSVMDCRNFLYSYCLVICGFYAIRASPLPNRDSPPYGKCSFYANNRVECSGNLRCKPKDFVASTGATCSVPYERSNGTWNQNQGVIPNEYSRIPSSNEQVASCDFFANGTFNCVGGPRHRDAFWEGTYTGSLNAAFDLGQDQAWFHYRTTTTTTTTTTQTPPTTDAYVPVTDEDLTENVDVVETEPNGDIERQRSRLREPQNRNTDTQEGDDGDQTLTSSITENDDVGSSIIYRVAPRRVFVCEYYTNGQVGCRNCTERIRRVMTEMGVNANQRDYNCTEPRDGPPLRAWDVDNGIVSLTPDPTAPPKIPAATCIFERSSRSYECHSDSATCPDRSNHIGRNRCLSGNRWTGEYQGDFSFLFG